MWNSKNLTLKCRETDYFEVLEKSFYEDTMIEKRLFAMAGQDAFWSQEVLFIWWTYKP